MSNSTENFRNVYAVKIASDVNLNFSGNLKFNVAFKIGGPFPKRKV